VTTVPNAVAGGFVNAGFWFAGDVGMRRQEAVLDYLVPAFNRSLPEMLKCPARGSVKIATVAAPRPVEAARIAGWQLSRLIKC
jgi:hypothetical protein